MPKSFGGLPSAHMQDTQDKSIYSSPQAPQYTPASSHHQHGDVHYDSMSPVMSQSNGSSPQPLLYNNFLTATSANQYDHHQHANQHQAQFIAR